MGEPAEPWAKLTAERATQGDAIRSFKKMEITGFSGFLRGMHQFFKVFTFFKIKR